MTGEELDLAAVRARHPLARNGLCALHQGDNGPCEARALLAEVDRVQRAAETMGQIISRNAEDICRIANVPMPEDGDADYELAWDRVSGMPGEIARLRERAIPRIPFPGGNTDAHFYRSAAKHLQGGYPVGGSNLTQAVIDLLRRTADHLDSLDGAS